MPALRTAIPLLLSLHVGLPVLAQPPPEPWEPGVRHLQLSPPATREVPALRITPGLALTVVFDSPMRPLRQGGVELEERGRFRLVSLDEEGRVLTLVLAPWELPDKPLRLTVHFADGAVPASAAFHPQAVGRERLPDGDPRRGDDPLMASWRAPSVHFTSTRVEPECTRPQSAATSAT